MEYTLRHVSGPATEPVSMAEVKAHLLIEDLTLTPAQTADLESKVTAARRQAETYLGKKIGTQVWDIVSDTWPVWGYWILPLQPLVSVDTISYTDEDGDEATVDPATYHFSPTKQILWLKSGEYWPTDPLMPFSGVRVRVTVGIQPESDGLSPVSYRYPDNIRQAILMRVGTLYNIREDMTLGTTMQAGKTGAFEDLLGGERLIVP